MSYPIEIKEIKKAEIVYCYTQPEQIMKEVGCIGHLRANMDTDGEGFFSTWTDHCRDLKTDHFKAEFDFVINRLRFGPGDNNGIRHEDKNCFLKNRSALARYCWTHMSAQIDDDNYGLRIDTDNYSYMMRLNPNKGEYNLYCYCYRRDWLDKHTA